MMETKGLIIWKDAMTLKAVYQVSEAKEEMIF